MAGTDRQGTSLAGLIDAAERVGFEARGVRTTPEGLSEITCPVIAHWRENGRSHFVVLFRQTRRSVTIGDPALGLRKLTPTEFQSHWTGVLVLLKPTYKLRELSTASAYKLWSLLARNRRLFLDALIAAVLMTILGLTSSFFIQVLVDFVFLVGAEPALNWLGIGMFLVLTARTVFLGLRSYLLAHLSHRIDADIVLTYHHHLLGLPLDFFWTRRTGEIISRMTDAVKVRSAVSGIGLAAIVDSTTVVLTSSVMLVLDWKLALVSLMLLPLVAGTIWALTGPMKQAQRMALERAAQFETHVVEWISSIGTIKAFRAEERTQARGEARFGEMAVTQFQAEMWAWKASTLTALFTGMTSLSLLWLGGREVLANRLSVGQLMAMYTMLGTIIGPIERLASANHSMQDALVAAERLGEVLQIDGERKRTPSLDIRDSIKGAIDFEAVSFRYGNRPPVMENRSFHIDPGECCLITGGSGSGKTTLVRSLARFVSPVAGRVLIDGISVDDFALDSLRQQVVYVAQDGDLLSISVADNIRLGRPDATAQELQEAARRAGAIPFIDRLPLGCNSIVGEQGRSLSGGERQRLALARAILVDPPILVLDEPTNHLDQASAEAVRNLIEHRRRDRRTTVLISHDRLPADRIVNLDTHTYATAT